jgi:hypothetical protein
VCECKKEKIKIPIIDRIKIVNTATPTDDSFDVSDLFLTNSGAEDTRSSENEIVTLKRKRDDDDVNVDVIVVKPYKCTYPGCRFAAEQKQYLAKHAKNGINGKQHMTKEQWTQLYPDERRVGAKRLKKTKEALTTV